jgi:hypothetical protein
MNTQEMYRYAKRTFLTTFLLIVFIGQGWMYNSTTFAEEEDLFEILQINKLSEPIEASAFSLVSVNGEKVKFDDYKGNVIFLNFWTTW